MTYLVDVNVLSEAIKPTPEPKVIEWLRCNESELVINPIILGEIRLGIDLLPAGRRRERLERWFDEGALKLTCLPIEAATGMRWAQLLARLRSSGILLPVKDSLIAATALRHGLTVATRNIRDFQRAGAKVFDPFA